MTRSHTLADFARVLLSVTALLGFLAPMRAEAWDWKDHYEKKGCTLTLGYWKNHSYQGPARCDDTWGKLCGNYYKYCKGYGNSCELDDFYKSGVSWLQALKQPPKGNPYWQLSHQYVAAVLNKKSGAWVPWKVKWVLGLAHHFFETCGPWDVDKKAESFTRGGDRCRWFSSGQIRWMARILGDYNEGRIGPGHCDDR